MQSILKSIATGAHINHVFEMDCSFIQRHRLNMIISDLKADLIFIYFLFLCPSAQLWPEKKTTLV